MEQRIPLPVCTVVQSLAGRDKGHVYVVVGNLAYPYVWIADGRKYNLDKPKKKNCRHLRVVRANRNQPEAGRAKITNEWIRSVIARAVQN